MHIPALLLLITFITKAQMSISIASAEPCNFACDSYSQLKRLQQANLDRQINHSKGISMGSNSVIHYFCITLTFTQYKQWQLLIFSNICRLYSAIFGRCMNIFNPQHFLITSLSNIKRNFQIKSVISDISAFNQINSP